jgi:hypothetical protein
MNIELVEFTRQALARGIQRPAIAQALKEAGWEEVDVKAALGSFADVEFPVPVPKPRPYLSPREVFSYLVLFAALYISIYNLGSLAFNFIDRYFPDPLLASNFAYYTRDSIRWNISSLIVAFPLFLFTFQQINKAIAKDPTKRGSRPRKWLTSITLFIAAITLTGDLTTLIYNALGGELTIRFVLKVITIAIIAGGTFAYFFWDLRRGEEA